MGPHYIALSCPARLTDPEDRIQFDTGVHHTPRLTIKLTLKEWANGALPIRDPVIGKILKLKRVRIGFFTCHINPQCRLNKTTVFAVIG
jgi:hypothetical protein